MDTVQCCTNGPMVGDGLGGGCPSQGKSITVRGYKTKCNIPGENNVVQVLWLHVSENHQGSPARKGYCYIDRAPVQNGKGPPPQFELNLIFLIYLGTLASHGRCAQYIPAVVRKVF